MNDASMQGRFARLEHWFATHRIAATLPVALLLVAFAHPTPASVVIGGALVTLGEALRIWASGHIDKNARLATAGPYAHTRNPLYVANLVLLAGFCAMAANPWVAVLALAAFALIYRPVIREEARHMLALFGDEYREWSREVPLFFPRLTRAPHRRGRFSWALVVKHREHRNALAFGAGIALFWALHYWRS